MISFGYDLDGCSGARPDTGPETYYRLHSPVSGTVTVTLTPHFADLDLVVAGGDVHGGCDPDGLCLDVSQNSGTAAEQETVNTVVGDLVFVIVDGYQSAISNYTIQVQCDCSI